MSVIIISPIYIYEVSVLSESDIQYVYYTDGTYFWRKGVKDSVFVIDKALTDTGFNGVENTDWENVYSIE